MSIRGFGGSVLIRGQLRVISDRQGSLCWAPVAAAWDWLEVQGNAEQEFNLCTSLCSATLWELEKEKEEARHASLSFLRNCSAPSSAETQRQIYRDVRREEEESQGQGGINIHQLVLVNIYFASSAIGATKPECRAGWLAG